MASLALKFVPKIKNGSLGQLSSFGVRYFQTGSKQISQPFPHDPNYCKAEEAVKCIKSGDTVFVQGELLELKICWFK